MSLVERLDTEKRYPGRRDIEFDPDELGRELEKSLPQVQFAFLLGSSIQGLVPAYSDLDVAVYFRTDFKPSFETITDIMSEVEKLIGEDIDVDPGILNTAGVVYRFETLKGKRLFVRPEAMEQYVRFYVRTCKEYEDYIYRMRRYSKYRRELSLINQVRERTI